jgi:undecaprenyl-diphosphatase
MSLFDVDLSIFHAINGFGLRPLDDLFVLASSTEFGLGCAAAFCLYFAWRRRWEAVWVVLALGLAIALADAVGARVLKPFIGRVRPCFALPRGSVRQLAPIAASGAMPSLHAANNMAGALVAFLADRRTGWVVFPVALLVGLSRIGVGVHWPSDVVAGAAWGAFAAGFGWVAARAARSAWRRRRGRGEERA